MTDYFDGIFEGDVEKLDCIFYSQGRLNCVMDGAIVLVDKKAYLEIVANRATPKEPGGKCYDRIISIDMAGSSAAIEKVKCAIPPKYFTDLLTFLKVGGKWQIINKAYHYVEHS